MQGIIEKLKNPVSECLAKMREEDLKKGCIKGAIIAVVMAVISAISQVISIVTSYWDYYSDYDFSEKMERIGDEIEDLEIFSGLFQNILIIAIAMAIVALMLFVIAKAVKNVKKYEEMLSIVNNVTILLGIGQVIEIIASLIYSPLAMIISLAVGVYAFFTMIETFKESIMVDDSNTLVLATTGVITVTVAIIMIITTVLLKNRLGDISTLFNFMSMM